MKRRPSFEEACARYPHRYTMEHVPNWAHSTCVFKEGRRYYAPQFRTDREWYDNTKFEDEPGYLGRVGDHYCYTTGQTWPLGKWLDAPFNSITKRK